jgi:uncharacterized protein involved in response to NO
MIFGYAAAVIVGFLFTAVRNWTNQPTPTGPRLAAIVALWIAARVLAFTPWSGLMAVCDIAFAVAAATALAVALGRARNRRNYFFVALLLAMAALNAGFYWTTWHPGTLAPARLFTLALDAVLFIMAVVGGRVMPMFTQNAIPGLKAVRHVALERFALGSILALAAADLLAAPGALTGLVALAAASAHGARLAFWKPWRTAGNALVWILHAAYAWIVVHLLLRAAAEFGAIPPSLATHALTVGGIGGLTLGMMTRTALGHTGRMLRAGRIETACYALVMLAAIVRVFGPLLFAQAPVEWVGASAILWALAFATYVVGYLPILARPRVDGKPG